MKKRILSASAAILLLTSSNSFAQFSTSGSAAQANAGIDNIIFQPSANGRSIFGKSTYGLGLWANQLWSDGGGLLIGDVGASFFTRGSGTASAFNIRNVNAIPNTTPTAYNWKTFFDISQDGNAGIGGSANSGERLTVYGDMWLSSPVATSPASIRARSADGGLQFFSGSDHQNSSYITLWSHSRSGSPGDIHITSHGTQGEGINFMNQVNGQWTSNMKIHKDGKVQIGNVSTPNDYKLYVEKGILTEKIKVASVSGGNWSDFVFADDYQLRELDEVKHFIKQNKHLPDVPSAKEVEKNGLDLVEMDAKLLQKVEELTLYIIKQQEDINTLKAQLQKK